MTKTILQPIHYMEQHILTPPGRQTRQVKPLHPEYYEIIQGLDGYACKFRHLKFCVSECREEDGRYWLHASVSRLDRTMPTYDDLKLLKHVVIGDNRIAIQVFPPADRHIDLASRFPNPLQVLHLWAPNEDFLPNFAGDYGTI